MYFVHNAAVVLCCCISQLTAVCAVSDRQLYVCVNVCVAVCS